MQPRDLRINIPQGNRDGRRKGKSARTRIKVSAICGNLIMRLQAQRQKTISIFTPNTRSLFLQVKKFVDAGQRKISFISLVIKRIIFPVRALKGRRELLFQRECQFIESLTTRCHRSYAGLFCRSLTLHSFLKNFRVGDFTIKVRMHSGLTRKILMHRS